jgi:hypothetical protein
MASNATTYDAVNPLDAAVPLTARILHLPITTDAEAFGRVARASERVLVLLPEPAASQRQALASFVVAGVEAELERLGAAPRGWVAGDALEEIVVDQLYRARLLGCFGVAVSFASVSALADAEGRLSAEDSDTLRRLVSLAEREPLQLHLPRPSADLMIAGAPQPLSTWLPPSREPGRVATIEYDRVSEEELRSASEGAARADAPASPAVVAVTQSPRATLLPPLLEAFFDPPPLPDDAPEASEAQPRPARASMPPIRARRDRMAPAPALVGAAVATVAGRAELEAAQAEAELEAAQAGLLAARADVDAALADVDAAQADVDAAQADVDAAQADVDAAHDDVEAAFAEVDAAHAGDDVEAALAEVDAAHAGAEVDAAWAAGTDAEVAEVEPPPSARQTLGALPEMPAAEERHVRQAEVGPAETPAPQAVAKTDAERTERCLAWAAQLQGMSGPKVHGVVEKAFIGAYLPLCRELAAGGVPESARTARDRWAEGFAQSYASAFRQLGGGARRPRMVRDVVELGSRWIGQHHARQCQLLLISAMRFDLGQRLNEEIERRLAGKAFCVEQCVLWTALPSNAEAQQLDARSAGRRGQPDPAARTSSSEIESGYVGSRELFRLRQLPDVLARPGDVETERLGQLASDLADTLVPWIQRQPPETLVVLFGDHGFHWEANAAGTSAAQRGGALPEQVLVPASAWLLREHRTRPRTAPGIH